MKLLEGLPVSGQQTPLSQTVLPPNEPGRESVPLPAKSVPEVVLQACIPELVSHQATTMPHAVAVAAGSGMLTYAELNGQANQLAHYLKSVGAGRERIVGLYLKRSPAFIVAALATLKAGAAYLPLDPDLPTERIGFMLRDSGVSALVTSEDVPRDLRGGGWSVVNIDSDGLQIDSQSAEAPETEKSIHPEDLAYVIYTSGSSGRPKGVEVTHSNLMNLVGWHARTFQLSSADRAGFLAALGFDAAVWELWPYLTAGASVHVPEEGVRNDAEALQEWLVERKITISFTATAMAERLLTLDWAPKTPLRILLTGADTLRHRPSATLPFTLVNNYGPTECTVVATSGIVTPASGTNRPSTGRPSIGCPIDNTAVYVMDEAMQALPQGETGELYIGGAGVARGYRNQPDLTAQRFVRPPSGPLHDLLYRTGDLGRVLPDGEIEFLGRVDEQVKIRGFRIEPNEIIAALNACPGVHSSAVVVRDEEAEDKRLIAYVALPAGSVVTAALLRDHLSKVLPDYMVPSAFIGLPSLPTTVNGKVDRASLPEPNSSNLLRDECYIAPRNMVEQRLAALIAPLLRVERVGVNDNFFLLGGHSLLGTQLITRISEGFGVDLSLLSLFDHPTLAGMSVEIERLILAKIEANAREELQRRASSIAEKTGR
jgi:amino acid adenylation domain-containing protein